MQLSIVIVNYNVEYFLEQCLRSVYKALNNLQAEVWVVDNNSKDGSVAMVEQKFPQAKLIANKDNRGFSYANNQAIKQSTGQYILLLNPDTVVEEDTFDKVVAFMNQTPNAGGLGVYMIDGKGNFLPESKRGLPTPAVAFYKIFGLAALFPKSRQFGRYHLGYLDKNEVNEVDVLSGAFMLMRKETLDKVGLLDETFFMYGEDIDLSYRIQKGGYKNYYYPHTRIIHYKGESTKKGSVNYVFVFYRAMVIFAQKHFSANNAKLFGLLINLAIYLRAGLAIAKRFLQSAALPLADTALLVGGMYFLKRYWEANHVYVSGGGYPAAFMLYAVPTYIAFWLVGAYYSGGYDKPLQPLKVLQGVAVGTLLILVIYALLSEEYRFSRALILLGAAWAAFSLFMLRFIINAIKYKTLSLNTTRRKRIAIVADQTEAERIATLVAQSSGDASFVKFISPTTDVPNQNQYLGTVSQLADIIGLYGINEVIFSAANLSAQSIIAIMAEAKLPEVEFKIAPPESMFIIGSNSINTRGELYVIGLNSIAKPANRRTKRLVDVFVALCLLPLLPIVLFIAKRPTKLYTAWLAVVFSQKTWVGYAPQATGQDLPKLKPAVVGLDAAYPTHQNNTQTLSNLNTLYAKDYQWTNDIYLLIKGW